MDLGGVPVTKSLYQKSILVTGSTGFLAKVFVEKVLREQPNVRKLFLLVRATDTKTAARRLQKEVIEKEVFKVLREKLGKDFDSFITNKVIPIVGDISCENLGVSNSDVREEIWREVDIIVNVAATTNFDERYDVSLNINALGAKRVLDFAKKCAKLEMLLHVSTAFVAGEREGVILEKPFYMGESLNGRPGLNIEAEMKLVEGRLKELCAYEATERAKTIAMKELGMIRSKLFGWPNTYVFTKALGEMLLLHSREDLPVVIIRPTIITSTYREPFPGWIEGTRTIDSLIVGYGKGKLKFFLGDLALTMDVIPGDMVVNAMIATMVVHLKQRSEFLYHVSSSVQNPVHYYTLENSTYQYFAKNPCKDKDGNLVKLGKVTVFPTMASFERYVTIRYRLPLKCLYMVNTAACKLLQPLYNDLDRKLNFVMRLIDIYGPYLFFQGRFDDLNLERLRTTMRADGAVTDMLGFDPKCIDWDDYFLNVHIPGVMKHVFK
ncbi:hypothetical protein AAC387_Pa05g2804 [Persea americana]